MHPKYKAVLFDLDDTLIDRRGAFRRAARRMYETLAALQVERSGDAVQDILVRWEREGGPQAMTVAMLREWPAIALSPDELWRLFRSTLFDQIRPDAEVTKLVSDLRRAGAKTGVITNGDAKQVEKIQLAGLTDLFDVVLVSDTVGIRKPSPAIFQMALDQVGSVPADSLFVGDNPPVDIEGARSAGLATAWVRAGHEWPSSLRRADYEADSLVGLSPSFFLPSSSR